MSVATTLGVNLTMDSKQFDQQMSRMKKRVRDLRGFGNTIFGSSTATAVDRFNSKMRSLNAQLAAGKKNSTDFAQGVLEAKRALAQAATGKKGVAFGAMNEFHQKMKELRFASRKGAISGDEFQLRRDQLRKDFGKATGKDVGTTRFMERKNLADRLAPTGDLSALQQYRRNVALLREEFARTGGSRRDLQAGLRQLHKEYQTASGGAQKMSSAQKTVASLTQETISPARRHREEMRALSAALTKGEISQRQFTTGVRNSKAAYNEASGAAERLRKVQERIAQLTAGPGLSPRQQRNQDAQFLRDQAAAGKITPAQLRQGMRNINDRYDQDSGRAAERKRNVAAARDLANAGRTEAQKANAALRERLALLGKVRMSSQQRAAAMREINRLYHEESGAARRVAEAQAIFNQKQQRGQQILQSTRSPLRQHAAQMRELKQLYKDGAMTASQFQGAQRRLNNEFHKSTGGRHQAMTGRDRAAFAMNAMGMSSMAGMVGGEKFKNFQHERGGREGSRVAMGRAAMMFGVAGGGMMMMRNGMRTIMDYGKQMSRVEALTGATGEELKKLDALASHLGERTIFSASQAAQAMSSFALAGFETNEIMAAMKPTLDLAAVGQIDVHEAAAISAKIMRSFGKSANELGPVVDQLAVASTNSATTISQLGESFKFVGPIASSAGIELTEVTGALMVLANAGVQGEMGGTALRNVMLKLANPSRNASKELKRLGIDVKDTQGNFMSLTEIFDQFREKTAGMGTAESLQSLNKVFEARAAVGAAALIAGGDDLKEFIKMLEGAEGTAARVAKIQLDNLWGQWEIVKSAAAGFAIEFSKGVENGGMSFLDVLAKGINLLKDLLWHIKHGFTVLLQGAVQQFINLATIVGNITGVDMFSGPDGVFIQGFNDSLIENLDAMREDRKRQKEMDTNSLKFSEAEKRVNDKIASDPLFMAAKRYEELSAQSNAWIDDLKHQNAVQEELLNNAARFADVDRDIATKIVESEMAMKEGLEESVALARQQARTLKIKDLEAAIDAGQQPPMHHDMIRAMADSAADQAEENLRAATPTTLSSDDIDAIVTAQEQKERFDAIDAERKLLEDEQKWFKKKKDELGMSKVGLGDPIAQFKAELDKRTSLTHQQRVELMGRFMDSLDREELVKSKQANEKKIRKLEEVAIDGVSPLDKFKNDLADLESLRTLGLSDAAFGTALKQLADKSGLFKAPQLHERTGALEEGTAAAFTAARKNKTAGKDPMLSEAKTHTKLLGAIKERLLDVGALQEADIDEGVRT